MEDNINKVVYQSTSDFLKYVKDRQKEKANDKRQKSNFKKKQDYRNSPYYS
ncbi:MAG: hypothetical protein U0457_14375 [Candidatus Sericytochromatia bacterium]